MKRNEKHVLVATAAALVFIIAATAIRVISNAVQRHQNSAMIEVVAKDQRTAEEVVRDYLNARARLFPGADSKASDEQVRQIAENATCLLKKLDITDLVTVQAGALRLADGNVEQTKASGFLKWLDMSAVELISQRLDCVKDTNGDCIRQFDGRACLLKAPLAVAMTHANKAMFEAGKGQIVPIQCFRGNLEQAVAYVYLIGNGCEPVDHPLVAEPGSSFHTMGLAMDLANQTVAEPYLAEFAVTCGFVKEDQGHCSLGESPLSRLKLKLIEMKKAMNEVKEVYDFLKEARTN